MRDVSLQRELKILNTQSLLIVYKRQRKSKEALHCISTKKVQKLEGWSLSAILVWILETLLLERYTLSRMASLNNSSTL